MVRFKQFLPGNDDDGQWPLAKWGIALPIWPTPEQRKCTASKTRKWSEEVAAGVVIRRALKALRAQIYWRNLSGKVRVRRKNKVKRMKF